MSIHPSGAQQVSSGAATSVQFDANNVLALTGTNLVKLTNGAGFTFQFVAGGQLLLNGGGSASIPAFGIGPSPVGIYGPGAGNRLGFSTSGTARWEMDASGNFIAAGDNLYDIGATGATRPKDIWVAGNLRVETSLKGLVLFDGHTLRANAAVFEMNAGNTVVDTSCKVQGRLQVGTTGALVADVIIGSLLTRTAGFIAQVQNNGARKWAVKFDARMFVGVPNSAPTDADLQASEVTFYLIEGSNTLQMRVKYSDGTTLKSLTTALALS